MKRMFVFIVVLMLSAGVALIGCEKKAEAPKPASMPTVTAPAAPAAPAPAPVPAAKPAKK